MDALVIGPTRRHPLQRRRNTIPDVVEEPQEIATDPPEAALDEQHHLGCLPNWEPTLGFAEQIRCFDSTTPENQLLMYALQPCSGAATLFDRRHVERAKDGTLCLDTISRRLFPSGRVIVGVDPAFASGPRASWFVAVVVLFVPATKTTVERRIILDLKRFKGLASVEAQGDVLQELSHEWQPEVFAIESNAAQAYLASFAEHSLKLPVKRIFTGEGNQEEIPALAVEFASGRWVIPWGDDRTRREMTPLINELIEYPQGSKDCLMALTFTRRTFYEVPARRTGAGRIDVVRF